MTTPARSPVSAGRRLRANATGLRSITSVIAAAAPAVARRPDLWPTAFSSYRSLVPRRWWRRAPFLPVPDARWLRFRLVTAYGGDGAHAGNSIDAEDLMLWLEWRRHWPADPT